MPIKPPVDRRIKLRLINLAEYLFSRKILSPDAVDRLDPKRVLIVRPHDQLGDFLLSTPAIAAIRNRFPNAHIGILVKEYFADAVRLHPNLDEVLVFYPKIRQWTAARMSAFSKSLVGRWGMAVVLSSESHSLTSDLLAVLSGAKIILGYGDFIFPGCSRNFLYNLTTPAGRPDRHQTHKNLDIVAWFGAATDDFRERIIIDPVSREALREDLRSRLPKPGRPIIGLHVGANKPANRWPPEKFAELANRIHRRFDANVLLLWGPREADLADRFLQRAAFEPVKVPPSSLMNLAAAFSLCSAAVCNDTGIMHLCAAVGTPLVALFGPIDPKYWKPIGRHVAALRGSGNRTEAIRVDDVFRMLKRQMGRPVSNRL